MRELDCRSRGVFRVETWRRAYFVPEVLAILRARGPTLLYFTAATLTA
jgi:hypothetical protein